MSHFGHYYSISFSSLIFPAAHPLTLVCSGLTLADGWSEARNCRGLRKANAFVQPDLRSVLPSPAPVSSLTLLSKADVDGQLVTGVYLSGTEIWCRLYIRIQPNLTPLCFLKSFCCPPSLSLFHGRGGWLAPHEDGTAAN